MVHAHLLEGGDLLPNLFNGQIRRSYASSLFDVRGDFDALILQDPFCHSTGGHDGRGVSATEDARADGVVALTVFLVRRKGRMAGPRRPVGHLVLFDVLEVTVHIRDEHHEGRPVGVTFVGEAGHGVGCIHATVDDGDIRLSARRSQFVLARFSQ